MDYIDMPTCFIETLGCKVNHFESESILARFAELGWRRADPWGRTDLYIVNTCCVTQKAAMQSRQAVRRAIRRHPSAFIIVTGCYAQTAPKEIASIPGVHLILGNDFKENIPNLAPLEKPEHPPAINVNDEPASSFFGFQGDTLQTRTRPFIKIQDGCNTFCSYCIVPYARGRSRSLPPDRVLDKIEALAKAGYQEVVICGIHIGRYGLDLKPKTSLLSLLEEIERAHPIKRVRLSSLEPTEITDEIIHLLARSRIICPHLHIPLQSGDDQVLKRMNRPYTALSYRDLIFRIVKNLPHVAIGADVMVGFPGESESAFANTLNLVRGLPLSYLHVFPYSRRKGTRAYSFGEQVPPQIIKRRSYAMRSLGREKRVAFYKKSIGTTTEVLIEEKRDSMTGHLTGLTGNYIPVLVDGKDNLMQKIVKVRLYKIAHGKVFGRPVIHN